MSFLLLLPLYLAIRDTCYSSWHSFLISGNSVGSPTTAEFPATWYVTAGGQANTTFEVASDEAGSWAYERELSVRITTLIA